MSRRRGFTLVEMAIAMAVVAVLFVMVYMLLFRGSEHAQTHATAVDLENQCRIILDQVTRDLRGTQVNSSFRPEGTVIAVAPGWTVCTQLTFAPIRQPDPTTNPTGGGSYDPFKKSPEFDATVTWSTGAIEAVDGRDNNGDGLVDEADVTRAQELVQTPDPDPPLRPTMRGTSRWPTDADPAAAGSGLPPQWTLDVRSPESPGSPTANRTPPAVYFVLRDSNGDGTFDPVVTLTVTLQGVDSSGRRLARSLTTTVTLRN